MDSSSRTNESLKILVMGGLGFIGSHLSRLLLQEGYQVRVFDKLYGSRNLIADIQNKIEIEEGDAERPEDILRALIDIDIAIDLIHTTVPGASMSDPSYDVQTNVVSHASWLSLLKKSRLKRMIYISSGGTVYGIPQKNPIGEDHPTEPVCSYGITKLAIEKYVAMYANMKGIEYRICRPANMYGEGQHLNIGQGVIGVFLEHCLKGQPIEIWGDGTNMRDYLYVTEVARGIVKLINHQGDGRIFNISSGIGYSLNDIIAIIRDELKIPVIVKYIKSRKFDVSVNVLDSSRLRLETGWEPQINMVDGMRRACDYLRRQFAIGGGA
ncbi:MAG: NAD-dependent epimerase/dehydratase family protein [Deltaproteobacteria bacterium]